MAVAKGEEHMSKHLETLVKLTAEPPSRMTFIRLPDRDFTRMDALCARLGVERGDWLTAVVMDAIDAAEEPSK